MIRQLLVMACTQAVPGVEVFSAADAAEGLALCLEKRPEIVVLDLVLPDREGLELVPDIRAAMKDTKILILSSHADEFTLHRVQQSGVNGFVDKNGQTLAVLQEALQAVLAGQPYYCSVMREMRSRMKADPLSFSKLLSDREMELLRLLGSGASNEDIALKVGLSPNTVRNHRQNIMTKLGIGSTPQLIRYAVEKGFTRMGT